MQRPNFIIIGAMKCATSTLHEQLARQRGIFMSTPKEPCFFSNDEQWSRGVAWYESLFAAAPPSALCGESSTHYTKLPTYPHTISRMRSVLNGDVKLIYIMRHPIHRLVSQYIHQWTQREISCSIDAALDRHPELIAYSCYAMQLKPHVEAFGCANVLPVFFERLAQHPQTELERVCRFLGYDGSPRWHDDVAGQNASSERLRKSLLRDAIINFPGLRAIRRKFVPQAARDWVKGIWSMKRRPQLSDSNQSRLKEIFDADLAKLGRWLELDLRCDTFHNTANAATVQWRDEAKVAA